jgi:hypothetical protein
MRAMKGRLYPDTFRLLWTSYLIYIELLKLKAVFFTHLFVHINLIIYSSSMKQIPTHVSSQTMIANSFITKSVFNKVQNCEL